jgi:chromosomal replication initiation ATPase DnaA
MGTLLASLHEEHKARQERLKKAAFKEVTSIPQSAPPVNAPQNNAERLPSSDAAEGGADASLIKKCSTTFDATVLETCQFYNVRPRDVFSNRHAPEFVKCRHIMAYILYDITSFTNPQIGKKMNRDPTSILHAINKIKSNLDTLQPDITEIERRIALHKEK